MTLEENACIIMSECAKEVPAPDLCLEDAVGSATIIQPKTSKRGGPRPGFGGPQPGSGRPRKLIIAPIRPTYAADGNLRWFCIRLPYLSDEAALDVDTAIRNSGFETFYPKVWVPPVAAHRTAAGRAIQARSERLVPLLRSYALVRFDRTTPSWRRLAAFGQVMGAAEWPTPIPDADIARMRKGLAANDCLYPPALPERATEAKRKWVDMATALLSLQMEPA